jgi:L-amino acid N-acyltransferase YncA
MLDDGINIEPMTPADWDAVRAIYREGIATGQATFEVEVPSWEEWDAGHHAFGRLVARSGGRVVGWAALGPVSRRPCYAGVAEVSVYVSAGHRGRGVGRRLLEALIAESERHGVWTLQGATFPENEASLRLQRACGFREVGRRERIAQLHGEWRDTVLTERRSRVAAAASSATFFSTPAGEPGPVARAVEVRPYKDTDQPAVIALWNEVLPDASPHNDPASVIRKKRAVEPDLFFVAVLDGAVVGTVMGGYDGHRGWVYSLAVKPEHRGAGTGSALVRRLEQALTERGCLKVNLQVRASNAGVVAFYEKLGYAIEERVSMGKRLHQ